MVERRGAGADRGGMEPNRGELWKPPVYMRTDAGAGGGAAGGDRGGGGREAAELWRVRPASGAVERVSAGHGSGPRRASRDLHGAEAGVGDRDSRSAEGGRGVCACGPGVSGGEAEIHAG